MTPHPDYGFVKQHGPTAHTDREVAEFRRRGLEPHPNYGFIFLGNEDEGNPPALDAQFSAGSSFPIVGLPTLKNDLPAPKDGKPAGVVFYPTWRYRTPTGPEFVRRLAAQGFAAVIDKYLALTPALRAYAADLSATIRDPEVGGGERDRATRRLADVLDGRVA